MRFDARPGVYLIEHVESGLVYVGSSVNVKNRISRHLTEFKYGTHGNAHLLRAWQKYGADAFRISILEYLPSVDGLIECEQRHIDARRCADRAFGYNIVPRADRREMSAETKAKISAAGKTAQLGKVVSRETREKIAAALRGSKLSPETIEKRSAKRRGIPLTPEHRAAVAAGNLGLKRSPQARENMRSAQLGKTQSEETIRKRSESMRRVMAQKVGADRGCGRKQSPETIAKRAVSLRTAWARRKALTISGREPERISSESL